MEDVVARLARRAFTPGAHAASCEDDGNAAHASLPFASGQGGVSERRRAAVAARPATLTCRSQQVTSAGSSSHDQMVRIIPANVRAGAGPQILALPHQQECSFHLDQQPARDLHIVARRAELNACRQRLALA
jgi:hypothetical protein